MTSESSRSQSYSSSTPRKTQLKKKGFIHIFWCLTPERTVARWGFIHQAQTFPQHSENVHTTWRGPSRFRSFWTWTSEVTRGPVGFTFHLRPPSLLLSISHDVTLSLNAAETKSLFIKSSKSHVISHIKTESLTLSFESWTSRDVLLSLSIADLHLQKSSTLFKTCFYWVKTTLLKSDLAVKLMLA